WGGGGGWGSRVLGSPPHASPSARVCPRRGADRRPCRRCRTRGPPRFRCPSPSRSLGVRVLTEKVPAGVLLPASRHIIAGFSRVLNGTATSCGASQAAASAA